MLTKFSRWLTSARRYLQTSKTIRRAPRSHVRWTGQLERRLAPAIFGGGVTVASGDVDGDGAIDMITGAGRGGSPMVHIYSGATGALIRHFNAFDASFAGGVFVASGDVNGDGKDDVLVGAGKDGGPRVIVFDGPTGNTLFDFFAYSQKFTGGVRVAAGDVNGDGKDDIITGAGPAGGPHVEVFNGADGKLLLSAFAYDPAFRGGIYVGAGDVTGDGKADVITGAGEGGVPLVTVMDPTKGLRPVSSFLAYDRIFRGGVRVAGTNFGNARADILTGAGPGGGPHVRVFSGATLQETKSFNAYDSKFVGGVYVARSDFDKTGADEIITGPGPTGGPNVRGFDGDTLQWKVGFYPYENDNTPVISPGPFADRVAPILTIGSLIISPTKTNPSVIGQATDNVPQGLKSVQVSIDGGANQNIAFDATGKFKFTTTLPLDGSADGSHTLRFTATDNSGNQSNFVDVGFSLDSFVTAPNIALADASDTGTKGDFITSLTSVDLVGKTDAGAKVELTPVGLTTTADVGGNFQFNGVPLVLGQNTLTIQATDSLGNTNQTTTTAIVNSAPQVGTAIANVTVKTGTANHIIDLSNNFTDVDLVGSVVQFNTSAGPVGVTLLDRSTPLTVANFLQYVNSGAYDRSIFHRLVDTFVLQGGGFQFHSNPARLDAIPTNPPVQNEPGNSNVRGTLAMAKLGGDPNSATSQWFFNLNDNSANLDNQNGGFTVFGSVTDGMDVIDALANLQTQNQGGVFNEIPMQNYTGSNFPTDTTFANYAGLNGMAVTRHSDRLSYSVTGNDNAGVVTASVIGNKLTLNFVPGQTGSANITIQTTDLNGQSISQTFTVTVNA